MRESKQTPLLVALGDSITAGVGGKWNRGYPDHLVELLKPEHPELKLINWGIPGLTATRLIKALRKGDHLYDRLADATWIVMTIGGNDIMNALPRNLSESVHPSPQLGKQLARQLDVLITTVLSLSCCPIYLGDLYNPFPQSQAAEQIICHINRTTLHPLEQRYRNVQIVHLSETLRGAEADTIQYYAGGTMRDMKKFWRRPIHPNDKGHGIIARAFHEKMNRS
ncbi:MAG: GDSL-type esterase/lipase family protein [Tumebacillaceae bacterium]